MDVQISCRNVEADEKVKQHAMKRAQGLLKYYDRIQEVRVILKSDGDGKGCEMVVGITHGHDLVAEGAEQGLHAAIDVAAAKLERQLRKHKERIRPFREPGHAIQYDEEAEAE